uniref:Gustatory receptor n=1 Tax=Panagrellus redivivus TaxID=6233 RepID=A0A7E4V686_PANRE
MSSESDPDLHRRNKLPPDNASIEDPPTYESATSKQRKCESLVGTLMLRTSSVFGLNPFTPPYSCKNDECRQLSFRDRICVKDLILCCFNIFVICNNLFLRVVPTITAKNMDWSAFSPKTASLIQTAMGAVLPLICTLGMMMCSYHMHCLLQKLSDAHFLVINVKCDRAARRWRMFFYFLMVFFIIGVFIQLPTNMSIEFSTVANETEIVKIPLYAITSNFDKILVFLDRYYFPIIQFGVVKIPQLIIMMISIRIAAMFQIEARQLANLAPTKHNLAAFFCRFRHIIIVLSMLECCFNKLTLAIVGTTVINIIFTSYVSIRELLLHGHALNNAPTPLLVGGWVALFTTFWSFCTIFSLMLNAVWIVFFIIPCIFCNEISRSSLSVITCMYVEDADAKLVKDQIIQKLMDPSWGLTLGKFVHIDRTFAITLMSFIFTVVIIWLQLETSLPKA